MAHAVIPVYRDVFKLVTDADIFFDVKIGRDYHFVQPMADDHKSWELMYAYLPSF